MKSSYCSGNNTHRRNVESYKMTDYNFYQDERVIKHVSEKYRALLYSFGKTIDEHFHGNVDNYVKLRQMFAQLRHTACKGKGKTLTDEQSK